MDLFDRFLKSVTITHQGREVTLGLAEVTPSNIRRELDLAPNTDFYLSDGSSEYEVDGDTFYPALEGRQYDVIIRSNRQRRLSDATMTSEIPRYRPPPRDYAESEFTTSDKVEFYYGEEEPIRKSETSRITNRSLAQAITSKLRQTVNENDIQIFCDGKLQTDANYSADKTYYIHYPGQPVPATPEIHDETFIVKKDIHHLQLADFPVPLVAVGRICAFLGDLHESAFAGIDFQAKNYIIFAHSLPAAFQQVALKLSTAFVYIESREIHGKTCESDLNNVITGFLKLTRQAEVELMTIRDTVLASLANITDPDFDLIKTATTAQIKSTIWINPEERPLPRDIAPQERFREKLNTYLPTLKLIKDPLNNTNVLTDAYIPFEKVVLPFLHKLSDEYHIDEVIQLIDVMIDIVNSTNNLFEQYPNIYSQITKDRLRSTMDSAMQSYPPQKHDAFDIIVKKYQACLQLFVATAPYGFVNGSSGLEQLRQDLQKAQFTYAITARDAAARN